MYDQLILDAARFTHFIGLALGMGLAMYVDASMLQKLWKPFRREEIQALEKIHHYVTLAIVMLWASGLTILYMRTGFDMAMFSDKVIFKIIVVSLMTLNALLVGKLVVSALSSLEGKRLGDIAAPLRAKLMLIGGFSAGCWTTGLMLGVFRDLAPLKLSVLVTYDAALMAILILGAAALSLLAPRIARWAEADDLNDAASA